MYCEKCHNLLSSGGVCDRCEISVRGEWRASSPTLIQGYGSFPVIARRTGGLRPNHQCALLGSLVWSVAVLLAIPWMLGERANDPVPAPIKPSEVNVQSAASPLIASKESSSSGRIDLTIRVPGDRWVDTGINICGCTNIHIVALGAWKDPRSLGTGATGFPLSGINIKPGPLNSLARQDALTKGAPYASLVARVGTSPFQYIGASRQVDGSLFSESGTLKIGMNAGRTRLGSGSLIVHVMGAGDRDHEVRYCAFPR